MSADAISAQAHVREAPVKVAAATGRSRSKVRQAMGVPVVAANTAAD
jgi:hypothetical protein